MSRWICVDDICIPSDENDWEELVAFADAIAEQEPIDIVRCGECERAEKTKFTNCEGDFVYMITCPVRKGVIDADDFCSYGEREGE